MGQPGEASRQHIAAGQLHEGGHQSEEGKIHWQMVSLFQEFSFVKADVLVKIMNIYNTAFYGSFL